MSNHKHENHISQSNTNKQANGAHDKQDHANGHDTRDGDAQTPKTPLKSYAEIRGDWETRPISIIGVVKRFISQLSYGQDLTRIAMPSEFLNPYSVLELIAYRYLSNFNILLQAHDSNDPAERMSGVMKWYFAALAGGKMYKKPYNPVVGETHTCYIETPSAGVTTCVAEQVSHHPPVSAFYIYNSTLDISIVGNVSFGVKFWLNSVTIATTGYLKVKFGKKDEEYVFSKGLPDLNMKNVVFGTRKMKWDVSKPMEVVCNKTGALTSFRFDQSGATEQVVGSISCNGATTVGFDGDVDKFVHFHAADDRTSSEEEGEEEEEETDNSPPSPKKSASIVYPPQKDLLPSMDIWKEVTKHIVAGDMTEADKAKHVVEEDQRRRVKLGEDSLKVRKYFQFDSSSDHWAFIPGSIPSSSS